MTASVIREIRRIRGKDLVPSRPLAEDCLLEYNAMVAGTQVPAVAYLFREKLLWVRTALRSSAP